MVSLTGRQEVCEILWEILKLLNVVRLRRFMLGSVLSRGMSDF